MLTATLSPAPISAMSPAPPGPGRLLRQRLQQARRAAQPLRLRLLRPRAVQGVQGRPRHLRRHRLPGRDVSQGVRPSLHRGQPALQRDLLARAGTEGVEFHGPLRRRLPARQRHLVSARRSAWSAPTARSTWPTGTTSGSTTSIRSITGTAATAGSTRSQQTGRSRSPDCCLSKLSSKELVGLLGHRNDWYVREARRILAERRDPAVIPILRKIVLTNQERWPWRRSGHCTSAAVSTMTWLKSCSTTPMRMSAPGRSACWATPRRCRRLSRRA